MRRCLPPLLGIALGLLATGLAALWLGVGPARNDAAALLHPVLAPGAAAPLPHVLTLPYDPLRPPPDATAQASGTGFFAGRHAVVTAAHVVTACRAIRLVSRHLPASAARLLAVDEENDIAVLRTDAAAPAVLDIAADGPLPGRVLVHGFPVGAARDVPATAWASLVNTRLHTAAALEMDPRALLWMQNRDIAQGYSGGPVLDPVDGRVVGIVRATIDPKRAAAAYGITMPDLSIGPGSAKLRAMVPHQAPASDGDLFTRARKATVHVFCWQ